jgi:hypothetical protein
MNYLETDFVDDIVKRVYSWHDCHNKTIEPKEEGFFAVISTYMPLCRNTGIYSEGILSRLCRDEEILILYPGFSWTEETIRQHTVKYLKELQIKAKEKFLKEDFNA